MEKGLDYGSPKAFIHWATLIKDLFSTSVNLEPTIEDL